MKSCESCYSTSINVDPKKEVCDTCYYKYHLHNLLAIIHRDGGRFVLENGLEKAIEAADEILTVQKFNYLLNSGYEGS